MKLREYMAFVGASQKKLADAMGVSPGLVAQHLRWLDGKKGTRITAERAVAYERATAGVVTRADLRPDLFGPSPDEARATREAARAARAARRAAGAGGAGDGESTGASRDTTSE